MPAFPLAFFASPVKPYHSKYTPLLWYSDSPNSEEPVSRSRSSPYHRCLSLLTRLMGYAHTLPSFPTMGQEEGSAEEAQKHQNGLQVKCLPTGETERCPVFGRSIICGRKIRFCDIISGDRECRCLRHKNFILGKCKPLWECSINNLRQTTGQHSCTKITFPEP